MNHKSTLVLLGTLLLSGPGLAQSHFAKTHPRRAEVNARLRNENRRIRQGVRNGSLSPTEAKQLHQEVHAVRQEERSMAAAHGGHITKPEQRALNAQETQVSRDIYKEKHD